jgi:hypothetical protein
MRQTHNRTVHGIGCDCRRCVPPAASRRRLRIAIRTAIRVGLLIGAVISIPFIVAWTIASANGGNR